MQQVPEILQQYQEYEGCLVEIQQQAQQPPCTLSEQTTPGNAGQPETENAKVFSVMHIITNEWCLYHIIDSAI